MTQHPAATWGLDDILDQAIQFKNAKGRWPNGLTRSGDRIPFSDFLVECLQVGSVLPATSRSIAFMGLGPGQYTVADIATSVQNQLHAGNLKTYQLDREALENVLEPLLQSMTVGGSVGPNVVISGRSFPIADFYAAYEDSPTQIRTDLAQLLDLSPPCTVGRAIGALRRYHREAV